MPQISLEGIASLEEYREKIDDVHFTRRDAQPPGYPNRVHFNEDGTPAQRQPGSNFPSLEEILERIKEYWPQVAPYGVSIDDVYVCGGNAKGTSRDNEDLDIGILCRVDVETARSITDDINNLNLGLGTPAYEEAKKRFRDGSKEFVQIWVHPTKPFGQVYSLVGQKWVSYGKTEQDHKDYEWHVLGIRLD